MEFQSYFKVNFEIPLVLKNLVKREFASKNSLA